MMLHGIIESDNCPQNSTLSANTHCITEMEPVNVVMKTMPLA